MAEGTMDRMMRMILPFRLVIGTVEGTWKLNQNKPDPARLAAATALEVRTGEPPAHSLARLMRQVD
jgi:transcriptional regulator